MLTWTRAPCIGLRWPESPPLRTPILHVRRKLRPVLNERCFRLRKSKVEIRKRSFAQRPHRSFAIMALHIDNFKNSSMRFSFGVARYLAMGNSRVHSSLRFRTFELNIPTDLPCLRKCKAEDNLCQSSTLADGTGGDSRDLLPIHNPAGW